MNKKMKIDAHIMEKMQKEREEHTFKPEISKVSKALCQIRYRSMSTPRRLYDLAVQKQKVQTKTIEKSKSPKERKKPIVFR